MDVAAASAATVQEPSAAPAEPSAAPAEPSDAAPAADEDGASGAEPSDAAAANTSDTPAAAPRPKTEAELKAAVVQAAAAVASAASADDVPCETNVWAKLHGRRMAAPLQFDRVHSGSPVRLLDARFLIALARQGGTLPRRQDLPDAAFVSFEKLQTMPAGGPRGDCLRVVAVSHPWLQPDEPDPRGDSLRLIAQALAPLVEHRRNEATYGVFLDYGSMLQRGPKGEERLDREATLFQRSLDGKASTMANKASGLADSAARRALEMMYSSKRIGGAAKEEPEAPVTVAEWFMHPRTMVFLLTQLPAGFPDGFTFPPTTNTYAPNQADYHERGWCFCESWLCRLHKDEALVWDLGKLTGKATDLAAVARECRIEQRPPPTPEAFAEQLEAKAFTNKTDDLKPVSELYADAFESRLGKQKQLSYTGLGWGDTEMASVAAVLATKACKNLEELYLYRNQIGDGGVTALASAIGQGALTKLTDLWLRSNRIGDPGLGALADAIRVEGALPALQVLALNCNRVGDEGVASLAAALRGAKGALPRLQTLNLSGEVGGGRIGDAGLVALSEALWRGALAGLLRLYLERNAIGDAGMRAFASAVARRALPQLRALRVHENEIGDSGISALSEAMLVNPKALEKLGELYLANNPVSPGAVAALKDMLRRRPAAVATDL